MNKWDQYFLNVCNIIAENSKCMSRKIGAILVRDKSIISTGYNGPPSGIPHCDERILIDKDLQQVLAEKQPELTPRDLNRDKICPRKIFGYESGEGLQYCIAGHSERNCLINAAKNGTCTRDTIMYMNCNIPCTPCLISIINAKVKEIVVIDKTYYDFSSKYLIENSNLKVRVFGED